MKDINEELYFDLYNAVADVMFKYDGHDFSEEEVSEALQKVVYRFYHA